MERQRTSRSQFQTMLEFMERSGDISRPFEGHSGRIIQEVKWRELSDTLNSDGSGVSRTIENWKRIWCDWKSKTKKKVAINNRSMRGTGGGANTSKNLTELEERLMQVIGIIAVTGLPQKMESGLTEISSAAMPQQREEFAEEINLIELPDTHQKLELGEISRTLIAEKHEENTQENAEIHQELGDGSPTARTGPIRRRRRQPPTNMDRAIQEFRMIEERKLKLEEKKEKNLHERKLQKYALQSRALGIVEEHLSKLISAVEGLTNSIQRHLPIPEQNR